MPCGARVRKSDSIPALESHVEAGKGRFGFWIDPEWILIGLNVRF